MSGSVLPVSSTSSRFGWPKPARIEEFKKLLAKATGATTRIVFQSKTVDIPIIRVPVELPKYRMTNGRTTSLQAEYFATKQGVRPDLFRAILNYGTLRKLSMGCYSSLGKQSDLQKYFEDTANKQVDAIVLDENGFVVNGNRRLVHLA